MHSKPEHIVPLAIPCTVRDTALERNNFCYTFLLSSSFCIFIRFVLGPWLCDKRRQKDQWTMEDERQETFPCFTCKFPCYKRSCIRTRSTKRGNHKQICTKRIFKNASFGVLILYRLWCSYKYNSSVHNRPRLIGVKQYCLPLHLVTTTDSSTSS